MEKLPRFEGVSLGGRSPAELVRSFRQQLTEALRGLLEAKEITEGMTVRELLQLLEEEG